MVRANLNEVSIQESGGEDLCKDCTLKDVANCRTFVRLLVKDVQTTSSGNCKKDNKAVILVIQRWQDARGWKARADRTVRLKTTKEKGTLLFVFNAGYNGVVRFEDGRESAKSIDQLEVLDI